MYHSNAGDEPMAVAVLGVQTHGGNLVAAKIETTLPKIPLCRLDKVKSEYTSRPMT